MPYDDDNVGAATLPADFNTRLFREPTDDRVDRPRNALHALIIAG